MFGRGRNDVGEEVIVHLELGLGVGGRFDSREGGGDFLRCHDRKDDDGMDRGSESYCSK